MDDLTTIERLYREHGEVVLRRARHLLGNEELARETLQEVFVSLVENPVRFDQTGGAVAWLYVATTNRCLNRLRNERGRARLLAAAVHASEHETPGAEGPWLARQLLAQLPNDLIEVGIYHFVDGMTQDDIAVVLRCSRRHVGNLIRRLRDTIERKVGKENAS